MLGSVSFVFTETSVSLYVLWLIVKATKQICLLNKTKCR